MVLVSRQLTILTVVVLRRPFLALRRVKTVSLQLRHKISFNSIRQKLRSCKLVLKHALKLGEPTPLVRIVGLPKKYGVLLLMSISNSSCKWKLPLRFELRRECRRRLSSLLLRSKSAKQVNEIFPHNVVFLLDHQLMLDNELVWVTVHE